MTSTTTHEEIQTSLIHDLRQPLGNMETSVFYLNLVLDNPSSRVRQQLCIMERQVAQAAQLLHRASEELRALRDQYDADDGAGAAGSLPFTKSATAAVT